MPVPSIARKAVAVVWCSVWNDDTEGEPPGMTHEKYVCNIADVS